MDSVGRIDRGFEHLFADDEEAIRYAKTIPDAAEVEVMRNRQIIARVRLQNGEVAVTPAL